MKRTILNLPASGTPRTVWTDLLGKTSIRCLQILIVVALAALAIWASLQIKLVIIPVLLALIIACAVRPVAAFLTRHGWPNTIAALAVFLAAGILLGGAATLITFQVEGQWTQLVDKSISGFNQARSWFSHLDLPFTITDNQVADAKAALTSFATSSTAGSGALAGATAAADIITSTVLTIVILFFFMKDGPVIWSFLIRPLHGENHARARLIGERAVGVLGGYIRGTVIVALVDGIFIGIGLACVGSPLAIPLGVIVFLLAFIPVIGATIAGIIAALVTLVTNGLVPAIIVVCIVVVVNQLEGNFLSPQVLGKSLKLHELVVLLALTIGTVLGGIVGTFLAVPIAAVGWAIIKAWNEPIGELSIEAAEGEG